MPAPITLPEEYYLDNFERLLRGTARYHDIFPEPQASQLQHVSRLGHDARKLLVRLFGRKGEWFRASKLEYGEIHSLEQAIDELTSVGLITQALPPVEIWIQRVTLAELKRLKCVKSLLGNLSSKTAISSIWLGLDDCSSLIEQANIELDEQWLQLNCQGLFELLLLLYFGNRYQDQSQFVVSELGLQRFEKYPLDSSTQSFHTAEQLAAALELYQLANRWDNAVAAKQPLQPQQYYHSIPALDDNTLLAYQRQKLLYKLARSAERQQMLDFAIACYQQCTQWTAQERLCRCLLKQGPHASAAAELTPKLIVALDQLWHSANNEAEQQVAHRIAGQVTRKMTTVAADKLAALKQPLRLAKQLRPEQIQQLTLMPAANIRVEPLTQAYFATQGYKTFFCENALLNGLFGLALWDIIFAPISGAFHHPYQTRPHDMYHDFVSPRQSLIAQRLSAIKSGDFSSITQHFVSKQGLQNDWVNWALLTPSLLDAALAAFSGDFLWQVCRRILKDPKHYRTGQPDLVLFGERGEVRFVEVKGPGDSLSDHQGYWLQFLHKYYSAQVCIVNFNRQRLLESTVLNIHLYDGKYLN